MTLSEESEIKELIKCFSKFEVDKFRIELTWWDNDYNKFNFEYLYIGGCNEISDAYIGDINTYMGDLKEDLRNRILNLIAERNNTLFLSSVDITSIKKFFGKYYKKNPYDIGKTGLGRNIIKYYIGINHKTMEQDIRHLINCLKQKTLLIEK